jgi:hypothetical protein
MLTGSELKRYLIVFSVFVVIVFLYKIWIVLIDTHWIWLIPLITIGVGVWVFCDWQIKKKARKELEQVREEERVAKIMTREGEYGKKMCQWLIDEQVDLLLGRDAEIMRKWDEYGEENCKDLIYQKIRPGMIDEMVKLSLGEPDTIDNREEASCSQKYRWIYGVPRQGATYIWFRNGKVTKVKQ